MALSKKSSAYNFFNTSPDGSYFICNLCSAPLKLRSDGSTCNMNRHMCLKHPSEITKGPHPLISANPASGISELPNIIANRKSDKTPLDNFSVQEPQDHNIQSQPFNDFHIMKVEYLVKLLKELLHDSSDRYQVYQGALEMLHQAYNAESHSGKSIPHTSKFISPPTKISQPAVGSNGSGAITMSSFFQDPQISNIQRGLKDLQDIVSSNNAVDTQAMLFYGKLSDILRVYDTKMGKNKPRPSEAPQNTKPNPAPASQKRQDKKIVETKTRTVRKSKTVLLHGMKPYPIRKGSIFTKKK